MIWVQNKTSWTRKQSVGKCSGSQTQLKSAAKQTTCSLSPWMKLKCTSAFPEVNRSNVALTHFRSILIMQTTCRPEGETLMLNNNSNQTLHIHIFKGFAHHLSTHTITTLCVWSLIEKQRLQPHETYLKKRWKTNPKKLRHIAGVLSILLYDDIWAKGHVPESI